MLDMEGNSNEGDGSATSSQGQPATPVVQIESKGTGHTARWVLLSVLVGFFLPVCSCAILIGTSFASLAALSVGSTSTVGTGDAVAIVRVEGVITTGNADEFSNDAVSGVIMDDLKKAEADPSVKAIVLRVDSPGGDVTGSAQIHEVLLEISKPVVVSMSGVAASGGYYISAPADFIFARPDSVTGSLGVILTLYNASELIDEIGIDVTNITSGPNKALGSVWTEMTPEHREILEAHITEAYDDFVRVVTDGRGLSEEAVRELADGRIFSGRQAAKNGLVDELGNMQDAIDKAANLGGISVSPRIVEYEHIPRLDQFIFGLGSRLNKSESDRILEIITEFTAPTLEYRYVGPGAQ